MRNLAALAYSVKPGQIRVRFAVAIVVTAVVAFFAPLSRAQEMYTGGLAARTLVTEPVDENKLVALRGNTHPAANAKNDRGMVLDSTPLAHMQMVLQRPPELQAQLEKLIDELGRPESPVYHKWLTAKEVGERFGPAQGDVETVSDWLRSNGFTVESVLASGMGINFSGNAGLVKQAFHTEIHQLRVDGEDHFANMTDPELPAALGGLVNSVMGFHDFTPHPTVRPRGEFTFSDGNSTLYYLTPADIATIYDLNSAFSAGYTGKGQTIALVEDSDMNTADAGTFRNAFGLSGYAGTISQIHPTGPDTCDDPGINGHELEVALDAEWAGAAARDAAIVLASCADSGVLGILTAAQNLLDETTPPPIVSVSYSVCEPENNNQAFVNTFAQAATEGVSVFVASGDDGGAGCDYHAQVASHGIAVNGIASTPYSVSVGGTDFIDTYAASSDGPPLSTYWSATNSSVFGSAQSYIPEIPWNSSCASILVWLYFGFATFDGSMGFCNSAGAGQYLTTAAGGGGPSTYSTQPSWQDASGIPTPPPPVGSSSANPRYQPDVSLFSADGVWKHAYVLCMSDTSQHGGPCDFTNPADVLSYLSSGGTSFATPIMAGIQALVNQAQGSSQGNPNPTYYALAWTGIECYKLSPCLFHTPQATDTIVPCVGTLDCFGNDPSDPTNQYGGLATSGTNFVYMSTGFGWDYTRGLGSVDAYNILRNWNGVLTSTFVAPNKDFITPGQTVTFNATVIQQLFGALPSGTVGSVAWSSNTGCPTSVLSLGGQATCTTSLLGAGLNTVTATYSGTPLAPGTFYFAGSMNSTQVDVGTAPTIRWNPPGTIISGTSFAGEMTATANATGTFVYYAVPNDGSPVAVGASTILAPGVYTIEANFTPMSGNGYIPGAALTTLTVGRESVWIVDGGGGTSELAGNGTGITTSADSGANTAVAIDHVGNVWSAGSGPLLKETSQVGTAQNSITTGGGLHSPAAVAIDGASQVWVANSNNSISLFANSGIPLSPSTGFTDPSLSTPTGIAIDLAGSVWIANQGTSTLTRILGAAAPVAPIATSGANNTTGAKP
jgi:hypothetical protein